MGRPKLKEEEKKVTMSLSLPASVKKRLEGTSNASKTVLIAMEVCDVLRQTMEELEEGKIDINDAIEDLEDFGSYWAGQFSEWYSHEEVMAELLGEKK